VNGLPRQEADFALRQHAPLTTGLVQVEDGAYDLTEMMLTKGLRLEEGFDKLPLGIHQVGVIRSEL
jgi:hypothetical protein